MRVLATLAVAIAMAYLMMVSMRTINSLQAEVLAEQQRLQAEVSAVDFCFEGVVFQKYSRDGQISQKLQADHAVHYEKNNRFLLSHPVFTFFHPMEEPWIIEAKNGVTNSGREVVDLDGDVVVSRQRGPHNSAVQVNTEQLRVYTSQRLADTKVAVSVLEDANLMRGVGGTINFKQGLIKLISQIKMWYKLNF